jgi:hypothetical protein
MKLNRFRKYDCSRYGHAQINNMFREMVAEEYGWSRASADVVIRCVEQVMEKDHLRLEGDLYRDALVKEHAE